MADVGGVVASPLPRRSCHTATTAIATTRIAAITISEIRRRRARRSARRCC